MERRLSRCDDRAKRPEGLRLILGTEGVRNGGATKNPNPWSRLTTWDMLLGSARKWGDRPAVIDRERTLSYAELKEAVEASAHGLEANGVGPGSRVGIVVDGSWLSVVSMYGALHCGATLICFNPRWDYREILFALQHSEVEVLLKGDSSSIEGTHRWTSSMGLPSGGVVGWRRVPKLRIVVPLNGSTESVFGWLEKGPSGHFAQSEMGELLFYSAKYGDYPRGVRIDPSAALGCGHYLGERLGITEHDRHLNLLPLCNSAGLIDAVFGMHIRGAAVCLAPSFHAAQLSELAIEFGCTSTGGSAFLVRRVVDELGNLNWPESVRLTKLWSAPRLSTLDDSVLGGKVQQFSCYGLAEASNLATISTTVDATLGAGTTLPGVEVKIVSRQTGEELKPGVPGEICFRGWNLALGYHREPRRMLDAIDEDGFFHTGDVGFLDERRNLEFMTRGVEALRSGGELISPRAIERFLESEWEAVTRVAIAGVADPAWGESVVALVVGAAESPVDLSGLRQCCAGRLASFKIPKFLVELREDQWPLNSDGSIDRTRIRQLATEHVSRCREACGHQLVTSA
jgi:fatty-acyl-CoA synthase